MKRLTTEEKECLQLRSAAFQLFALALIQKARHRRYQQDTATFLDDLAAVSNMLRIVFLERRHPRNKALGSCHWARGQERRGRAAQDGGVAGVSKSGSHFWMSLIGQKFEAGRVGIEFASDERESTDITHGVLTATDTTSSDQEKKLGRLKRKRANLAVGAVIRRCALPD